MDKQKTNFNRSADAVRRLVCRILAIGLVLYWLYDLVKSYLAGGEDAPSKTLLIIAIVVLGGGAVFMAVLTGYAWKLDKDRAKLTQEEIDRAEELRSQDEDSGEEA